MHIVVDIQKITSVAVDALISSPRDIQKITSVAVDALNNVFISDNTLPIYCKRTFR